MGKNYSKVQRDAANYKLFQQMDLADTIPANERNDCGITIKVSVSIETDTSQGPVVLGQHQCVLDSKVTIQDLCTKGDIERCMDGSINKLELKLRAGVNGAAKKAFTQAVEFGINTFVALGVPERPQTAYAKRTPETRRMELASTFGLERVDLRRNVTQAYTSNEYLATKEYTEQTCMGLAYGSVRNSINLTNRLQGRHGKDRVRRATVHAIVKRKCGSIERKTWSQTKEILQKANFDTSKLDEDPGAVCATENTDFKAILGYAPNSTPPPVEDFKLAVFLSSDGVCNRAQTTKRSKGKKGKKQRGTYGRKHRWTWHYTLVIRTKGWRAYYVVGRTKEEAMVRALAVLIANNLLKMRELILCVDGEEGILDVFNSVFSFVPCKRCLLDWWHLQKKVKDTISRSTTGSTEVKRAYIANMKSLLWYGDTFAAIELLSDVACQKRKEPLPTLTRPNEIEKLIAYIKRKEYYIIDYHTCQKLGVKLSSNITEGANRCIISSRQKRNGTSWTENGCGTPLAHYFTLKLNNGGKYWFNLDVIPIEIQAA